MKLFYSSFRQRITHFDNPVVGAVKINNAFSANFPIVAGNSDFETVIKSNDLSFVEFYLVDANLHEINLLCPLYLTIHVQPVPDNDYNIYKLMLEQQNPPEGLS